MQTFKKLIFLLSPKEQKKAILLLFMIIIMALLDMIGVASILPFMAVLTNTSLIETNLILNKMFLWLNSFGVHSNDQFIFVLGVIVFLLLIISLFFKALTTYAQVRFVQMREHSIGKRLLEAYLNQPYSWFLNRHSADLGKTILSEVQQIIRAGMRPLIELFAKGITVIAIITLLIVADPKLTISICFSLSLTYGFVFFLLRKYLNRIGEERLKSNELRFMAVIEAFGASKEIKVGGLEKTYVKNFSDAAKRFAKNQASSQVISQFPRFILEAIAFGGVLLIILYIIAKTGSFNNALPIISLYVYAGYRLLPALHQIYASFTQLTFIGPSVIKLHEDLKSLQPYYESEAQTNFTFDKKITLQNIFYNYPKSSRTALKNINLSIFAKTTVGFVGATGSGKTTIVDIILGLLEPKNGRLKVDGKTITKLNSRSWKQIIGYVPQHIYLSDDTIEANIAFGVDRDEINYEMVEKAAKIANLHDFIDIELPKKYMTKVGERGVRLSGGQRQRIGIARALYHNPKVLILDEATSALDNETEQAVMDAVNNLSKSLTIILIAHRLNTVKNCDVIFKLKKGELDGQGSFDELVSLN